ncbi:MAG: type II toxin-antitoxin system VapC family toxin [Chroococcidiopsidaceae cyanobacterium CP_BM_ER_R8_30]|nr:type II toxin-antitoxin system VapC family toxin [Chroococcidiopsidaceae cyanobacterium CP_BM_ER_R8_30]
MRADIELALWKSRLAVSGEPLSFVIDCSVAMAWCFEDEATDFTDELLERLCEENALVPSLWPIEVANVLTISERRGRTNQAKITTFLQLLRDLPITIDSKTAEKALTDILVLARANGLTSYDAAYLELALRAGLHLATLDNALAQAARHLGVNVLFSQR